MTARSLSTRTLATFAAAGVGFFVLVAALLPLVEPGYDLTRQAISELALGPGGWLLDLAFCLMGAAWVALAIVFRRTTGATAAPVLLTIAASLDVVSAFVHADRFDAAVMTTPGTVHVIAGISTFVLVIASIFAMVRPFGRNAGWQRFSRPTLIWACICAAAFVLLGPGILGQAHFGLQQRGMAVTFLSWLITAAIRARRAPDAVAASTTRPQPDRSMRPATR
jgi:hypothetical membrane protein